MTELCDVLVIGSGPAGSTIAALLAAKGEKITLLEKDRHPRFHIGESLLPMNLPLLDRLGVREEVEKIGMPKYGVEFVSPYHQKAVSLEFAQAWDKNFPYSYQVRRADFDHILLKNAAAKGAEVIEECKVAEVDFLPEGGALVTATDAEGTLRNFKARFVVDATGRDTLLASRLNLKERNRRHNSAAVYGHFTNAERLPGQAEGNISIFWFDYGWIWFIPLADGTTSVGAVCRPDYIKNRTTKDVTEFFQETLALSSELSARLTNATLTGPATATGNYSYRASRMTGQAGQSYLMLGDAFAFIDPVFSTGVYLAMRSAFLGAEAVETCLHKPANTAKALRQFDREVRRGIDTFSWYIYRITRPAIRDLFMHPQNRFRILEAVLSLLAGEVSRHAPIWPRLRLFKAIYYLKSLFEKAPQPAKAPM